MGESKRIRNTRSKGGFGKFILGWFVGFICTLLLILGVGYWAYNSISIRKLEKWTKTEITNNDGIENKSVKEWVAIVSSVFKKDSSAYTIAQFEEDFGIELIQDSIYGIDLTPIKSSPLSNIKEGLNTAIDSATFNNILTFMEITDDQLGLLNTVLNKELTYYISGQKLYVSDSYSTEVDFKYTVDMTNNVVKFSNGSHTISSGTIKPRLADLPLNTAMQRIQEVTNDLAIYEVLGYTREGTDGNYIYKDNGVTVTGILSTLSGYSVGDLSKNETFNDLYIYEVLGYTREGVEGAYIYKDGNTEVDGVLKYLAPSTIENLSATINSLTLGQALDIDFAQATGVIKTFYGVKITELDEQISNIKIYQAMGYYKNEEDGMYYENYDGSTGIYSSEVLFDGILKAIADTPVNELSSTIDNLKAVDVFDSELAILKLFTEYELNTDYNVSGMDDGELKPLTVMDLPQAVVDKINDENTTLGDLLDAGVITMDNPPADDDPVRLLTIVGLIELAMQAS